jgi:hypothetical protein
MKKLASLFLIACLCAFSFALAGCGDDSSNEPATSESSSAAATAATETDADVAADAAGGEASITAADLANVDIVIEYGDYDAMKELSANIQNARGEGFVVQVDGLVVNYGQGMSYSIVEPNDDGSARIGSVFKIEGASEADYPQDGQRVKITGIVGSDETGYTYFIKTLPEFVEAVN